MPDDFESFLRTNPLPATTATAAAPAPAPVVPAAAPSASPFESFLQDNKKQADAQVLQQAQATAVSNSGASADAAAQAAKVGRQIDAPQAAVEADLPRYQAQALAQQNAATLAANPKMASWVAANPDSARVAQNDFDGMAQVEPLFSADAKRVVEPILMGLVKGAVGDFNNASLAVNRFIGDAARGADSLLGTKASDWWYNNMIAPALENKAATAIPENASFGVKAAATTGGLLSTLLQIIGSGGASLEAKAVGAADSVGTMLAQTAKTGSRAMVFPSLVSARNTAQDVYDQTGDMRQAIQAAQMSYATTTLGGIIPLGAPGGLGQRLASGFVSGATTGEVSRQAMNLVLPQKQGFDPEQTILAGLSGAMLGGFMGHGPESMGPLNDGVRKTFADAVSAENAERGGQMVEQLSKIAQESKLREADPAAFKEFIRSQTEGGTVPNVYVDGKLFADALHQSGLDPQQIPGLPERLAEATTTGGDVQIPIEDYATHIAGTPTEQAILPNLKTEAGGMTYAEGQKFYQDAAGEMKARAQDIVKQHQILTAEQTDINKIGESLMEQMQATGRFPDDVARASLAPVTEFYRTMAARMDMSPADLYKQFPLKIVGESPATDGLNQGPKEGPFGPITEDFKGDAAGAIAHLKEQKNGEAIGALHHPDIGDIDLPWGKEGSNSHDGAGLAKLVRWHPEVVDNLQDIISSMEVTKRTANRMQLESPDHKAAVRLTYDGEAKKWLLTAFEKEEGGGSPRTDTATDKNGKDDSPSHASEAIVDESLKKFYQENRGGFDPKSNTIGLLKDADLSTFMHESGHFFLSTLGDLAGRDGAPQQIKDDMQTAIKWMGGKDLADWNGRTLEQQRDMHEKFARGFETYLMEGKAPTQALQPLFARFRSWLINVYRNLKSLGADLSPEVRGVMDRLLASDTAIRETEQTRSYFPLDLSKTGATEKEQADYAALGQKATQDAVSELQARSLRDMQETSNAKTRVLREMKREAAGLRKGIQEEVTKEVMAQPVEQAREFIKEMAFDLNPERSAYREAVEQHAAQRDEAARESLEAWIAANPEPSIAPHVSGAKPSAADRKAYAEQRKAWVTARDEATAQRAADWAASHSAPEKPVTPQAEWAEQRDQRRAVLAEEVKADFLAKPEVEGLSGIKKGQYLARNKREMANEVDRRVLEWERSNPKPEDTTTHVDPEMVAEEFGFSSGKELRAALAAESRSDKIQRMTDERMLQRHGELLDPAAMDAAANEAVHNAARAKFMATGLKLLAKSPVPASELARAATEAAHTAISAKLVKDVEPRQYEIAETKANREAIEKAPTDVAAAIAAQRQALLSNRLAKAAHDALAEIKKIVAAQARYDKASIRAKMDPDILEQIDALRERFDFRRAPPDGSPTKQQIQLQQWIDAQKDLGYAPLQNPDMLDPSVRKHYQQLTVEQLRGFNDTIRSMEAIARARKTIMVDGKRQDLAAVVAGLVEKMQARGDKFTTEQLVDRPRAGSDSFLSVALDRMGAQLRSLSAELKPQQYKANQFDMHELMGPFTKSIFQRVFKANYDKVDMLKSLSTDFKTAGERLGTDWQKSLNDFVPNSILADADISKSEGRIVYRRLTRGDMLGIARHVGNESNFDKLAKGMEWQPADIWRFLHDNMTAKDWEATQKTWDAFERHWPAMVEMNKRLGNTSPDQIERRPFRTQFGEMAGGYAPLDYDPIRSKLAVRKADASAIDPSEGLFGKGYYRADTTTNGSLNSRVANYYDRLDLDFHSVERRLHDTIHDLAYREALLDVHKILTDADFRRQFQHSYGPEQYRSLQNWIGDLANGQNRDQQLSRLGAILGASRRAIVANGIALRISTTLKHGGSAGLKSLGYFTGGGEKYFASRVAAMGTRSGTEISGAMEKFPEIRARLMQQDRDYRQLTASMFQPESFHAKAERFGHSMVAWSDMMTAVPTAWAAYDRAITEGIPVNRGGTGKPMSEKDAVAYADQIVREAHGSNIESARSMVLQNNNEAVKMMTTLYGFMNNSLGQHMDMVDKFRTAGFSKPEVLSRYMMAMIVPALWAGALEKHHGKDGQEESWIKWAAGAITGEYAGMVPFAREAWAATKGYPGAGLPAYMSVMGAASKPVIDAVHAAQGKPVKAPIKDLGNAIGLAIPGFGQIGTTLQYAADVKSGKEQPRGPLDVAKGLALGHGTKD